MLGNGLIHFETGFISGASQFEDSKLPREEKGLETDYDFNSTVSSSESKWTKTFRH